MFTQNQEQHYSHGEGRSVKQCRTFEVNLVLVITLEKFVLLLHFKNYISKIKYYTRLAKISLDSKYYLYAFIPRDKHLSSKDQTHPLTKSKFTDLSIIKFFCRRILVHDETFYF